MSLVTIVDFGSNLSIISDGRITNEDNILFDCNFKKFLVKDDYFIAITGTYIVAKLIFEEFKEKNLSSIEAKNYLDNNYKDIKKNYNIIIGMEFNKVYSYIVYSHYNKSYERNIVNNLTKYCVVMKSENVTESVKQDFENKIYSLISTGLSNEFIIHEQKNFHLEVAEYDNTVNKTLFHQYFIK